MLIKFTKNPKEKRVIRVTLKPGEIKFKVNLRNTLITNNYYYFAIATSTAIINKSKQH